MLIGRKGVTIFGKQRLTYYFSRVHLPNFAVF